MHALLQAGSAQQLQLQTTALQEQATVQQWLP
jgi:hypothetical protein